MTIFLPKKTRLIPSTSKKVQAQQVARSELTFPTPIVRHFITERQNRASITDAINFTENQTNSLPFETHFKDIYSILLIRGHHESSLFYIHHKTCKSSFAVVLFHVLFNLNLTFQVI